MPSEYATMIKPDHLHAVEILDSRGRPTVAATMRLADGTVATVSVPSGASTGKAEAKELRDHLKPYRGLGCRKAIENVRGPIAQAVVGREFSGQEDLDLCLIELDGTTDKSRLGANAILATSLVFARAAAACQGISLFRYFADLLPKGAPLLPRLRALVLVSRGPAVSQPSAVVVVALVSLSHPCRHSKHGAGRAADFFRPCALPALLGDAAFGWSVGSGRSSDRWRHHVGSRFSGFPCAAVLARAALAIRNR